MVFGNHVVNYTRPVIEVKSPVQPEKVVPEVKTDNAADAEKPKRGRKAKED